MFHTLPHKVVAAAAPALVQHVHHQARRDAAGWAYQQAYAQHAPYMAERWARTSDPVAFNYAKADVLAALEACGSDPAYVGKCWAEIDAIRDREHALRLKAERARRRK